jgi:hypothetical protein
MNGRNEVMNDRNEVMDDKNVAVYDQPLALEIQASINDPRPNISHEIVMAEMLEDIAAFRREHPGR